MMTRIDWLAEARAIAPRLVAIRRELHEHPELGNDEHLTSELILRTLDELGARTSRPFGTAVMGDIKLGGGGPAVALRADMDALPVREATGAPFASKVDGIAHVCGHDIHMTAALGAAMLLASHGSHLRGTVRLLFEPDEEGSGGAAQFVEAGCMDGVDAVFGAHVSPDIPLGKVGIRYGKFYAASDTFDIKVIGRSAHGAEPERGIDSLAAAAELVVALRHLPDHLDDRAIVTVGTFASGTARNVIAPLAELSGIIRTLGPDARAWMKDAVARTTAQICDRCGARHELALHSSYSGVVNSDDATRIAHDAAISLLGDDNVVEIATPTMTSEDFGVLIDAASGSFYHIGAGCASPLHSADFLPHDDAIVVGTATHCAVIERYLSR